MDFGTERWIDAGGTSLHARSWGEDPGRDVLYWHGVGLTSRGGASLGEVALARVADLEAQLVTAAIGALGLDDPVELIGRVTDRALVERGR